MSDSSDDVLRQVGKAAQGVREAETAARQVRAGEPPVQAVKPLESALRQMPGVQQATQQVQRIQQVAAVAQGALGAVGGLEALSGVVQALGGQAPLDKVRFSFQSSAAPGAGWRVVALHAREGLSELYTCGVDLANEHLDADVDGLLGSSAEVLIAHEAGARRLCGIVHRVEHLGTQAGHLLARAHVVPALWALSLRKDQRIFQEKTVPEVLEEVLLQALRPFERPFRLELNREYLPREYCVQYRESDLDFLQRLMEEEGIVFYFDHSGEKEELVLIEENEQSPACQAVMGTPITVRGPEAATASDECLRHFDYSQQLRTTSTVVRDFNWTHPDYDLTRESRSKDELGRERESYEYPAPLLGPYDVKEKKYKYEPAQKQELQRRQAFQAEGKRGLGEGYVTGFTPGYMFELTGHGHAALDQWYLLTRVEHHGDASEELTQDSLSLRAPGEPRERYRNTFECIPLDVPFKPERRRPRARMAGLQTATVVGPSSEEIHTDEHGRIKVQFHWDRQGKRDEKSSCFLRVAQAWAGLGWGFVFLPRIGMEVLVDFLEGDPDRPLVVGCVYNGKNTPPYALPEHKTRSTIRTSSSKDSDGFNELRFEDAKDAEEIFLHAQKDFNEVVLHNHSTSVKANQTNAVDGSQSETVGGDQSMSVTGKRTKSVDKDETTTVKGKRTETVDQDEDITIKATRTERVTGKETLTLDGGREATVKTQETLTVNGNRQETINGNDDLTVTGYRKDHVTGVYEMKGDAQVKALQGEVSITLEGKIDVAGQSKTIEIHNSAGSMKYEGSKIDVTATSELNLVCGNASISLKKDGTVEITGSTEVTLSSKGSSVKVSPEGVSSSGGKVTSSATGINEITGLMVKIN
ncbi:type VI secretion system tip protein VgrG [Myxococcus sp. K38C18041901]|uniref:type VI secretion system Vgr family protein n=1 Tax=Myxococcus guangdongensis TaxID=2906760 RepID=UPI0020A7CD78|nr:type VI secretion system tip protein TssI/VgrG [Myxococcus guangdongensis]MCP3065181.1 type VI secretion system tip protein VgrG [Myxococcus guangdongensis]